MDSGKHFIVIGIIVVAVIAAVAVGGVVVTSHATKSAAPTGVRLRYRPNQVTADRLLIQKTRTGRAGLRMSSTP